MKFLPIVAFIIGLELVSTTLFGRWRESRGAQAEGLTEELRKQLFRQPLTEVLIGAIFTFAGLFFAGHAFAGTQARNLAYGIAAAITLLASWGAFTRFLPPLREANLEEALLRKMKRSQIRFCIGLWLMLISALVFLYFF